MTNQINFIYNVLDRISNPMWIFGAGYDLSQSAQNTVIYKAISGISQSLPEGAANISKGIAALWQFQIISTDKKEVIKDKFEAAKQTVQEKGLAIKSKGQAIKKTLLNKPQPELKDFNKQLAIIAKTPDDISLEGVQQLATAVALLSHNDNKLLMELAPNISPQDLEICRSVFSMIQSVSENENFIIDGPNPLPEIAEEALLEPLMKEEAQNQLIAFSSIMNGIIASNNGYLFKLTDSVAENPKTVFTVVSLVTAVLTGSWMFGAAGAASGASLVKDPSMAFQQGRVFLLGHPLLTNSRSKMIELNQAITKKDHAQVVKSGKELKRLLRKLSREQQTVFTPVLKPRELQGLNHLKEALFQLDESSPPSIIEQLEKPVANALVLINERYRTQKGIFEAGVDMFAETIEGPLQRIDERVQSVQNTAETLVNRIDQRIESVQETVEEVVEAAENIVPTNLYNTFGIGEPPKETKRKRAAGAPTDAAQPDQQVPPAASPVNLEPVNAPEEGSLAQFLMWAASNINALIGEKYAGILSNKTLPAATGLIAVILNQVLGTLDNSDAHRFVKGKLTEIVAALNNKAENKDWSKVLGLLDTAAKAMHGVKIYVGNFRLPIPGTGADLESGKNAEGVLSENITALNAAIATPEPEPENQNWKDLAIDEKDRLVSNATSFLTMKHIYEEVCGLRPPNEAFYRELLRDATDTATKVLCEEKLKELFFERLNAKKISIFKKVYAEIQYWLYGKGVKYFTKKATTIYFEEIFKYIANQNTDKFNFVRGMVINNFTRYLTILGGAYKTVANTPSATGLMSEMLMKELEKKEANLGFETNELYLDFAKIILKKTGGSTFGWFISKFLGNPEEIIRSVIDVGTGSLQDTNGYTHAINTVIGDQLGEIWNLLQASQSNSQTTSNEVSHKISEGQKNQLSILVNNLFEILRKSKCNTVDELRNLMEGKLLSENVNQAIDGLFIQDIIEQTTHILASTVESLLQEKQLQKLTYTFAKLINNTFEVAPNVSQAKMQEAEEKVSKLSEQILGFAVNSAIKDRLDFSGKQQQNETNNFIEQLHKISNDYFDGTSSADNRHIDGAADHLQKLTQMEITSLDAKNKINEITEATLAYEKSCHDLTQLVKASPLNNDNKDEINKRILKLAEVSKPFIAAVEQLKIHSRSLEDLQRATPRLEKIRAITGEIGGKLYQTAYASEEAIEFAESQMMIMESLISELPTAGNMKDVIPLFVRQYERLGKIIVAERQALLARSLQSELRQPDSLLEQIVNERKSQVEHGLAVNREKLDLMKQQKLILVSSDALRPQLHSQLKAIEDAILPTQVETAQVEFMRLLNLAVDEANQKVISGKDEHWDCYHKVDGIIKNNRLVDPQKTEDVKIAIRKTITSANQHLGDLKTWENKNHKQITYSNFSWSAMKWLQDGASEAGSNIVHKRVRERLDGVLSLLKREETYRYGILHHSLLIPYVQRIKKQNK